MSKEILLKEIPQIERAGNCLTCSLTTIVSILDPDLYLNPYRTEEVLSRTDSICTASLFDLFAEFGCTDINHEIIEVAKRRRLLFQVISQALQSGAICELCVKTSDWTNEVLHDPDPGESGEFHSVVVYGYYQPEEQIESGYFYVADFYRHGHLFVNWDDLFNCLCLEGKRKVAINLFGLCLDHAKLIKRFADTKGYIKEPEKQNILDRIPKKGSSKEKLTYLLKPRRFPWWKID